MRFTRASLELSRYDFKVIYQFLKINIKHNSVKYLNEKNIKNYSNLTLIPHTVFEALRLNLKLISGHNLASHCEATREALLNSCRCSLFHVSYWVNARLPLRLNPSEHDISISPFGALDWKQVNLETWRIQVILCNWIKARRKIVKVSGTFDFAFKPQTILCFYSTAISLNKYLSGCRSNS